MGARTTPWALALLLCCLVPTLAAEVCPDRKAACERTCKGVGSRAEFQCNERGGAVSSSCACAAAEGAGASSSASSSSNSSSTATGAGSEPGKLAPAPEKADYTNCDVLKTQCKASCPPGAAARVLCDRAVDGTALASAATCTCVADEEAGADPPAQSEGGPNGTSVAGTVINGAASQDVKASEVGAVLVNAAWSVNTGGWKVSGCRDSVLRRPSGDSRTDSQLFCSAGAGRAHGRSRPAGPYLREFRTTHVLLCAGADRRHRRRRL